MIETELCRSHLSLFNLVPNPLHHAWLRSDRVLTLTFMQCLLDRNEILIFLLFWRISKYLNGRESWFISAHCRGLWYQWISVVTLGMQEFLLIMQTNCNFITAVEFKWHLAQCWGWLRRRGRHLVMVLRKTTPRQHKWEECEYILNHYIDCSCSLLVTAWTCGRNLHCKSGCPVFPFHGGGQTHADSAGSKQHLDTRAHNDRHKRCVLGRILPQASAHLLICSIDYVICVFFSLSDYCQ